MPVYYVPYILRVASSLGTTAQIFMQRITQRSVWGLSVTVSFYTYFTPPKETVKLFQSKYNNLTTIK